MNETRTNQRATVAYVGLGSNLGDRRRHLIQAMQRLAQRAEIEIEQVASLYETSPVGGPSGQPPYLNSVARLKVTCTPRELLNVALSIEASLGRQRDERWAARTIDIDILLLGDEIVDETDLHIPHPRLHLRRFVLEPLCELAGEIIHPTLGKSIAMAFVPASSSEPGTSLEVGVGRGRVAAQVVKLPFYKRPEKTP